MSGFNPWAFRALRPYSPYQAEQNAAQLAAFEAYIAHQRLAADAGRRLEAQSLRPPTLADLRTPYAEQLYEGLPLVSYDDDFLRSLGIRP